MKLPEAVEFSNVVQELKDRIKPSSSSDQKKLESKKNYYERKNFK